MSETMDVVGGICRQASAALAGLKKDIDGRSDRIARSPFSRSDIDAAVARAEGAFEELGELAEVHRIDDQSAIDASDAIHASIEDVTSGHVGKPFSSEELEKIYSEGKVRFQSKTPPGFADEHKDGPPARKFGDLVIWKEVIAASNASKRPAVLITEDLKLDWWRLEKMPSHGPHPTLREEFETEVGRPFWAFSVAGFMARAIDFGATALDASLLADAEALEAADLAADVAKQESQDDLESIIRALELLADAGDVDSVSEARTLLGTVARHLVSRG
jgi:hypothetical protein